MSSVLITGAAGRLGSILRTGLRRPDRQLHLTDVRPLAAGHDAESTSVGDLADLDTALRIVNGVDVVVHSAGIPDEAPFEALLDANIRATYHVFEAARRNGIRRIIYASSHHVIGFHPRGVRVSEHTAVRPDTLYGATKVFGEGLARLYADKYGLDVACLRIGSFRDEPENHRQLSTWLSPRDAVQLVERCIIAEPFGYAVLYGVSANHRRWWYDHHSERLGYHPADDAEQYAPRFPEPPPTQQPAPSDAVQGGVFAADDYHGGAG